MKKVVKWIEHSVSDSRNFTLHLLALVAILTMPSNWAPPVLTLSLLATIGHYAKKNPTSLQRLTFENYAEKVLALFKADQSIFRCSYFYLLWFFWIIFRNIGGAEYWLAISDWISFAAIGVPLAMFAVVTANTIRTRPKITDGTKQQKHVQKWTDGSYAGFLMTFIAGIVAAVSIPGSVGSWMTGWLTSSALDANITNLHHATRAGTTYVNLHNHIVAIPPAPTPDYFPYLVNALLSAAIVTFLWPFLSRFAAFLVSVCKQTNGKFGEVPEAFLRTLRTPRTDIRLRDAHPFLKNSLLTLAWLGFNYAFLFWLVGFSQGPLADAILGWLDASVADAGTGMIYGASANPHLRMFCGAIFALYGTVPVSVMGSVFLPYAKRRQLVLTADGITLPDGPYLSMHLRPMRLWSDFKSLTVKAPRKNANDQNTRIKISFHSGGSLEVKLAQLQYSELESFCAAIDEHASDCQVSDDILTLRTRLRHENSVFRGHEGELGELGAQRFQSTVFVPHEPGTWLPNGESRVVRLLASRPLSCVYLVRLESGKLAIAKQFFFADETEETSAIRKCFQREYELLQKVQHKAVSKVLEVFDRDQSTYLVVEHASGTDLRTLVEQDGVRSEEKVIDWGLQICDVLTYLHSLDPPIVHRDLTPDNVVLAEDGSVRVIDFGAAHQFMEGITGTIIGKQCYVAPEQLRGQAGPLSDVYSFGCMLYFLLTGKEPVALTPCLIVDDSISQDLSSLIRLCTSFEETERPQSFAALTQLLQSIKNNPPFSGSVDIVNMVATMNASRLPACPASEPISSNGSETKNNNCSSNEIDTNDSRVISPDQNAVSTMGDADTATEHSVVTDTTAMSPTLADTEESAIIQVNTREKEQVAVCVPKNN